MILEAITPERAAALFPLLAVAAGIALAICLLVYVVALMAKVVRYYRKTRNLPFVRKAMMFQRIVENEFKLKCHVRLIYADGTILLFVEQPEAKVGDHLSSIVEKVKRKIHLAATVGGNTILLIAPVES